jgi:hypothetical protein
LTVLRAVDAAEADTLRIGGMQDSMVSPSSIEGGPVKLATARAVRDRDNRMLRSAAP